MLSNIRMHVRQISRSIGKPGLDLCFLLHQLFHPCLHGWLVHTVLDGVHDVLDAPLNLLKGAAARFCLPSPFMVLAVGLSPSPSPAVSHQWCQRALGLRGS